MNQNKHFADFIKNKRKEKDLTTSQLATLSGLSQSYISNLENGNRKTPKIETINKLATGLGLPNGTLMMAAGLVNDPFSIDKVEEAIFKQEFHKQDLEELEKVNAEIKRLEKQPAQGDLKEVKQRKQRLTDRIDKYNGTYVKDETVTKSLSVPPYLFNLNYLLSSNHDLFFDEDTPSSNNEQKKLTDEDKQHIKDFIDYFIMKKR
ncbi:helix-turn-helix transcriptional regulator [Bacillus sp. FSL M8-0139]|uniref:helix-turn-helix domain-containing protein n=1 Tax=Bacillus sp. FSL M8-0139 TaxID=2921613 RepID=UPI0030FABA95